MEPERPIEKLLRDYAQKRREESGPPLELHPVSRRVLQAEVARTFPASRSKPSLLSGILAGFWPKLALGTSTAVVAILFLTLWLPSLRHRRADMELARNEPAPAAQPADNPATAPAATPPPVLAQNPTQQDEAKKLADSVAAASAPSARELAAAEPAQAQPEARDRMLFLRRYGSAAPSKNQPVPAPGVVSPLESQQAPSAVANSAVPLAPPASAAIATDFLYKDKAVSPVLAAFRIEGSGSDFRIIDRDGSVYRGSIQLADTTPREQLGLADGREQSVTLKRADRSLAPAGASAQTPAGPTLGQTYSFRVTGTNQSLNQLVVFNGQLVGPTNSLSWVQTNLTLAGASGDFSGALRGAPVQSKVSPLPGQWILGQVELGTNQQVRIQAVPAKP